ncbi:hypothetical protein SCA6_008502 [Theobroma cacao]
MIQKPLHAIDHQWDDYAKLTYIIAHTNEEGENEERNERVISVSKVQSLDKVNLMSLLLFEYWQPNFGSIL